MEEGSGMYNTLTVSDLTSWSNRIRKGKMSSLHEVATYAVQILSLALLYGKKGMGDLMNGMLKWAEFPGIT